MVDVRLATSTDADFIEAMLVEAATWASDHHDAVLTLADERNAHYVADWPRPNDLGIIACGDDGTRLGAAWLRYFGAADPGYGFVNHDIPELSIGVSRPWRGRGIGSLLLRRLHTEAASRGVRAISLSVERANPAVNLYRRIGYEILTDADDAFTMMIVLE